MTQKERMVSLARAELYEVLMRGDEYEYTEIEEKIEEAIYNIIAAVECRMEEKYVLRTK